jgi:MFS family permease
MAERFSWFDGVADAVRNPYALVMTFVFAGANFVAVVFLTWLPTLLHDRFHMTLSLAGLNATVFLQTASVIGVLAGGWMADNLARGQGVSGRSGRQFTQMIGLFCGVPFIFLQGWTHMTFILIIAMSGFGLFKGLYDANIWASLYEVIPVGRRGTTVGLMNSIGWLGGGLAPIAIAAGSQRFTMGTCISATAIIYLCGGLVLLFTLGRPRSGAGPMPQVSGRTLPVGRKNGMV